MSMHIRNKEMLELRENDSKLWTYGKLGEKYRITRERVRQTIKSEIKRRERFISRGMLEKYNAGEALIPEPGQPAPRNCTGPGGIVGLTTSFALWTYGASATT